MRSPQSSSCVVWISVVLGPVVATAACSAAPDSQGPEPVCGNGVVDTEELCDDGSGNHDSQPDACRTDCRFAHCGDGVVDTGELCDDGFANSDTLPGACRRSCQPASCGDGIVDPGEECDDGGLLEGDGCGGDCQLEPHWRCEGTPSQCECRPHFGGPQCEQCVVFVSADASATEPDGRSWETAYARLQVAVDRAAALASTCEVWARAGTYEVFDFSVLNTLRLASGVSLLGGFDGTESTREERDPQTNLTVIDGFESAAPHRRVLHVVTAVEVMDAVLSGVTIRGGSADGDLSDGDGGGLYVYGSSLRVDRGVIEGNEAVGRGGGIYSYGSVLQLLRVALRDNEAAEGGGLHSHDSTVQAESVLVSGNLAGGAVTGVAGGAYHGAQDQVRYNGCTFADNHAPSGAALFVHGEAVLSLRNSILWGNGLHPDDGLSGDPEIAYSDVQGSSPWTGVAVLQVDPLFVGASDHRLQAGSPLIDVGDDLSAPATDLLGRSRHDVAGQGDPGTAADLGCYEYQP